ncbi:MAG: glycerol-3-phosphate 1-O-acyltransferase PlsY [Candidatus Omnitrophica bacterium]|nr:glycerol-3-phosphate 1-O-acyltransferase PlsY [Candidatus Omnitrophota bacterium]
MPHNLPPLIVALAGSYLVGSLPTGYLFVRWLKRIDLRTIGSGNVGATNVSRAAGAGAGGIVLLMDIAKGLIAVLGFAPWLIQPMTPAAQLACGLAAVIGHAFPVFLRFQGGKGVATTIGVLGGVMPLIAALCLGVWLICFLLWRYVSVGSLAAAVTLPIAEIATHRPLAEVFLGAALAVLIVVRHRSNIERLVQGTEHQVGRVAEGQPGTRRG